ncbi:MAG: Gfo/Idh/MocA family oxidoreductase [Burkholderiaceae bacterium]
MEADTSARPAHSEKLAHSGRKLRLGVAGMGRGFLVMLPTLSLHPRITVVAGMDPRAEARERFTQDFGGHAYKSFEALCDDTDIEAVYIASPHQFHREQVQIAARRGKHILVEKPMALTLDDCRAMTDAANAAGVHLIVGHSHGFDAPVHRARQLIQSGAFGRLRMISALNYTDFLYRPRRREELQTELGGGVVFSQGSHQIDVVRTIANQKAVAIRAYSGAWDPQRPTESAYSALLTFEDGLAASLTYSGHAHFDSDELCGWIGETGKPKDRRGYGTARRLLSTITPGQEDILKRDRGYGGPKYTPPSFPDPGGAERTLHEHFGLLIASCDRADLRPGPHGVTIYGDEHTYLDPLEAPVVPRSEVIDELYAAAIQGKRPFHSGEWATANLEICLAILQSSQERREVLLLHQIKAIETREMV